MEEFLPGLVRLMEERLGKVGRPLTTIVIISLALGATAWGLKLFWDNAISPISQFIQTIFEVQHITLESFVRDTVTPFSIYLLLIAVIYFVFRALINKRLEKTKATLQEIEEIRREAKEINQATRKLISGVEPEIDKENS